MAASGEEVSLWKDRATGRSCVTSCNDRSAFAEFEQLVLRQKERMVWNPSGDESAVVDPQQLILGFLGSRFRGNISRFLSRR